MFVAVCWGRGVLFGGGSGVRRGRVSVLGGGVAGLCAARVAAGMGADVTVFDVDVARMRYIDEVWVGVLVRGFRVRWRFGRRVVSLM
ncbi:hypothetical protein TPCU411_21980 [Cutibacterium acnes]|nr:hypothetical protein TPCU411_21980 [Cutibacterium acnes]